MVNDKSKRSAESNERRKEILETAKRLFNERGYNSVSIRDISQEVGISNGNLTYYFKKKEDLVEALLDEFYKRYRDFRPEMPITLAQLNGVVEAGKAFISENAFYFVNNIQLMEMSDQVRYMQNYFMKYQMLTLQAAFKRFNENGTFIDEEYPGHYNQLIRLISMTCMYWVSHNQIEVWKEQDGDFMDTIWSLLYPVLTKKGLKEYRALQETE